MPQLINADFDMKLTTRASNRVETAAFLEAKPTAFALPDYVVPAGYKLLASKESVREEGKVQTICLIFNDIETVYKVKTIVRNEPNAYLPIKNCTQLIVWRELDGIHSHVLTGFARSIFNFLLLSHNIMITDEQQTADGRRFWLSRMSESFLMDGRSVYYVDLNVVNDDIVPVVERIHDRDDLIENYVEKGWGDDESHKERAFIISKQNLA